MFSGFIVICCISFALALALQL